MKMRAAYNYDTKQASIESGLHCTDESKTVQSMKDEADINVMIERFGVTGQLRQSTVMPSYQDFDEVIDFRTAMDMVNQAKKSFMEVDAKIRSRFNNDPQEFLEFCSNVDNLEEMRKLGLAVPGEVPAAVAPPNGDAK